MVSFKLEEVETLAQEMFREFGLNEVWPLAQAIDSGSGIPAALMAKCWETGVVQSILDEAGTERSRIMSCAILEELGWADASTAVAIGASMGFVQALVDYGTAAQRDDIQQSIDGRGPLAAAILIQEPGLASHAGAITTCAVKDGALVRLNGTKSFVPRAAQCRYFLVLAQSERGAQAIIVPTETPGVRVDEPIGTLGLKGLALATVRFDDVELPAGAILGGDNGCEASRLIASSRTGLASILTGLSRAVFEHIMPYTKERVAHGTALARKQSVAFRLADMVIDIPSMRWMAWRAASTLQKGRDAAREARLAQIHCGERALAIADEGVQLMGGHGYIRDNPAERRLRDARTLSLLEGMVGV